MDVADWLRQLGLERYEAAFRANDVSAEVLLRLTADDLRELGVLSVGHRRQMLDAIEALRSVEPPMADLGARFALAAEGSAPERRQLSVMFCDIVVR
jgi:hypothetical protein